MTGFKTPFTYTSIRIFVFNSSPRSVRYRIRVVAFGFSCDLAAYCWGDHSYFVHYLVELVWVEALGAVA
jgi:hypothetical protein